MTTSTLTVADRSVNTNVPANAHTTAPTTAHHESESDSTSTMAGSLRKEPYTRHRLRVRVTLFFRTRVMKMTKESTVQDLRDRIVDTMAVEPEMFDISFDGSIITHDSDSQTLLSAGLSDKCHTELVMSKRFEARETLAGISIYSDYDSYLIEEVSGRCNPNRVEVYLEAGASANACDKQGTSLLHHAAAHDCLRTVSLLRAHGANPNIRDRKGCTPLQTASFLDHNDVAQMLLRWGCDSVSEKGESVGESNDYSTQGGSMHVYSEWGNDSDRVGSGARSVFEA